MKQLAETEPKEVFSFFEQICHIPHGSGNTDKISNYLVQFAKDRNLFHIQDSLGNVIMKKPATPGHEQEEPYILQGHMDMVTVKNPDCTIDMEKEGLNLAVDGDYLYAKGTSLGGDDGIAVAYALAILDSDKIEHPELEVIFTVDEEVGMEGAAGIDVSSLRGSKMLNMDSEDEGIFLTSCAGGMRVRSEIPYQRESTGAAGKEYLIELTGLSGGHSGQEIDKGRANGSLEIGRFLDVLNQQSLLHLMELGGGEKDNAIPTYAYAKIVLYEQDYEAFRKTAEDWKTVLKSKYSTSDPKINLSYREIETENSGTMTSESTGRILAFLRETPNGVQKMSEQIEGLVETSLNLGIMKTEQECVTTEQCLRSSVNDAAKELRDRCIQITERAGGKALVRGVYPAWEYRENSELRDHMIRTYRNMFGQEPKVEAIHAGLECGLFAGKIKNLDCISFGPQMMDIHTTSEKLSISSTARTWEYVKEVLKNR